MAIVFDTAKISDDNWRALRKDSNGSMISYMQNYYGANTKFDKMTGATVFIFFSRESYVEFCLKWM